jgi:hypothetical protein
MRLRRVVALAAMAAGAIGVAAAPSQGAPSGPYVLSYSGGAYVRFLPTTNSGAYNAVSGLVPNGTPLTLYCWIDNAAKGGWAYVGYSRSHLYWTDRWFNVPVPGDHVGTTGFISAGLVANQTRVPRCVKDAYGDYGPPPTPTQTPPQTPTQTPPQSSPPPAQSPSYAETTGGVVHTWTNYLNAGGTEGPEIGGNQTVLIACKIQGFTVADGDTWWYRIASPSWSDAYYGSADAFYNNGETSGSLKGTPFFDPNVPNC